MSEEPWVNHRNIFRGKNLGDEFTAAQKAAIRDGSFKDLYVGDYWLVNNRKWAIADINYWLNDKLTADTFVQANHLVIVPLHKLYEAKMNDTNTTTGGYAGSKMRTQYLDQAKTIIYEIFGESHILTHEERLTNTVSNGFATSTAWMTSQIELLNQVMALGSMIFPGQNSKTDNPVNNSTIDKTQLALFRLRPELLNSEISPWWLRDVVSAITFASIESNGDINNTGASNSIGVRPVFGLIG